MRVFALVLLLSSVRSCDPPPGCDWEPEADWRCGSGRMPATCEGPLGAAPAGCVAVGPGEYCCAPEPAVP